MRGNALAKILRRIADAVDKLDEAELDSFLTNLSRKDYLSEASKKKTPKNVHAKLDPVALEDVLSQLGSMTTRASGHDLLDRLELSRKELEALARLRSIHVTKDDNLARIREKLVEGVIGARLSSRAIRGTNEDT